jgi:hypothetical protein
MMTVVNKVSTVSPVSSTPPTVFANRCLLLALEWTTHPPTGLLPRPGFSSTALDNSSLLLDDPRSSCPTIVPPLTPLTPPQYVVSGRHFTMTFLLLAIQSGVCVLAVWGVKRAGVISCERFLRSIFICGPNVHGVPPLLCVSYCWRCYCLLDVVGVITDAC